MVDEKVLAALEACASLLAGYGPEVVINRYREHVAANAKRLAASSASVGTYRANGILRWVSMLRRKLGVHAPKKNVHLAFAACLLLAKGHPSWWAFLPALV
jgi:hypothetical protein